MGTLRQLYQLPQITKAPEVRHIRSLKSLHSGGFRLRANIKFGSAVGAVYPRPCKTTILSLPIDYFIESDQTVCSNFMTEVEFRLRPMPHLRRFFSFWLLYTPRKCCAFPWGYGHAAPKRGWFHPWIGEFNSFCLWPTVLNETYFVATTSPFCGSWVSKFIYNTVIPDVDPVSPPFFETGDFTPLALRVQK